MGGEIGKRRKGREGRKYRGREALPIKQNLPLHH